MINKNNKNALTSSTRHQLKTYAICNTGRDNDALAPYFKLPEISFERSNSHASTILLYARPRTKKSQNIFAAH